MSKARVSQPPARNKKPLTLADVTLWWTDDSGHVRQISGQDIAFRLARPVFFATDLGERYLWQSRLRGLSALVYPDAGISIYDSEGRSLMADLLQEITAGIAAEHEDLPKLAKSFVIQRRGAPWRGQS